MSTADQVAALVNEWFQAEPTPERQQNMRRTTLIRDLQQLVEGVRQHAYEAGYRDATADGKQDAARRGETTDAFERRRGGAWFR